MPNDLQRPSGLTHQPYSGEPSGDLGLINYFDALYGQHRAQVTLESGDTLTLERQGLGVHYLLTDLGRQIREAALEDRVAILKVWLEHGGADPSTLQLSDFANVAEAIKTLNSPRGMLAWEITAPPALELEDDKKLTDYEGRQLARIVHTLAFYYHWSLEDILEMPREVALAHAQECMLEDHRQRRWQHFLSEVAWEYDKGSKTQRYRPLPAPPWADTQVPSTPGGEDDLPEHIKAHYFPGGVVIDLQDQQDRKGGNDATRSNKGPAGRNDPQQAPN